VKTRVIILGSLGAFGLAGWLAFGGSSPVPEAAATKPAAPGAPVAQTTAPRRAWGFPGAAPAVAAAPGAPPKKLNVNSQQFRTRVDDMVPSRLYAEASRCYKGGLTRDRRVDIEYHIRVTDGAVAISNVRLNESTLGDTSLERCIRDKVAAVAWRDDELPDLDEEGDVYMRVDGFAKYLANAEDTDYMN
jgi:hypothetical protein